MSQADGKDPGANLDNCDTPELDQSLEAYAAQCDAAMNGVTVPSFHCDQGSKVDEGNEAGGYRGTCDRPNVLNSECDPDSRFQVLPSSDPNIQMVAHCRKKGRGPLLYGDIAVIQYNKQTGATCFYQSPVDQDLPEFVAPPSSGTAFFPWNSPKFNATVVNCVMCHDNGPFVRSPYLTHLKDDNAAKLAGNVLPGSHDTFANTTQPYKFVGNDFQTWKVYSLSLTTGSQNLCLSSHRMGISQTSGSYNLGRGTAQNFGLTATAASQSVGKNPGTPLWMLLGQPSYSPSNEAQAKAVATCGSSIVKYRNHVQGTPNIPPPPDSTCNWVEYGQGNTCRGPSISVIINGATQAPIPTSPRFDYTVPLGNCIAGQTDCPTGFAYWTTLHGSFWQVSPGSVAPGDPSYRGGFATVRINNKGNYEGRVFTDSTGQPAPFRAAPGGTLNWTAFQDLKSVPDPKKCTWKLFSITDLDGKKYSDSLIIGAAGSAVTPLTGFIGDVAQNIELPDFLKVFTSGNNLTLAQAHLQVAPSHVPPNGPLSGETWASACTGWAPIFAVKDVLSQNDVQLVAYPASRNAICYLTGLTGAWSSTRSGGSVQPYAEIYIGPSKDIRLRVAPDTTGSPADRVGAYASCININ